MEEAQLAPQLVKLADGAECRVGVHVLATRSSSRGAYFAGDFGTVTALKGKDVFVRWDHNGETTIASAKRLQVARGVRLASGRPARPGMTVKLRPDPQSSNRKPSKAWTGTILRVLGANKVKVQWHGRHSKQETLDAHRLHAHDDRTVRIAAYNIGTHCQTLRVRGSEAMTVKRMVEAGAPKYGRNAAEFMGSLQVDLLGVQEILKPSSDGVFPGNGPTFARFMGKQYKCHQSGNTAVVYNRERFGNVVHLDKVRGGYGVRGVSAIYIPHLHLVFMSVWLNHSDNKVEMLETIDESLRAALGWQGSQHTESTKEVARVVIAMDSNDHDGDGLNEKTVRLLNQNLRHVGVAHMSGRPWPNGVLQTCAEDCDFSLVGDYIFDSAVTPESQTRAMHLGEYLSPELPDGHTPFTQLMSDHLPVMWDGWFEKPREREAHLEQVESDRLKRKQKQLAKEARQQAISDAVASADTMDVVFIRHGQSEANAAENEGPEHYDAVLTEEGHQQALAVNKLPTLGPIPHEEVDTLFVSPLRRTLQTANNVFKDRLPRKIVIVPEAREIYWAMHSCRGHVGEDWHAFLNDPKYIAPEFRARIVNPEVMDEPSQHFHPEEEGNVVNSSTVLGDRWTPQTTDGAAELLQSKACLALQQFVNKLAHCQKTGTAGKKIAVVCHWGVIFNITRVKPSNCEVIHTKWFQHPEQLQNAPQVSSKDIAAHNRKFHASVHAVVATLRMAGVMFHHKKVNKYNPLGIDYRITNMRAARRHGVGFVHVDSDDGDDDNNIASAL